MCVYVCNTEFGEKCAKCERIEVQALMASLKNKSASFMVNE